MKLNNVYIIIILSLVCVILFQRIFNNNRKNDITTIQTTDTIYQIKHDTIIKTVNIIKEKIVFPKNPIVPGTTIDTCKNRFDNLTNLYYNKKIYSDTLEIYNLGKIVIVDTVWMNGLYNKRQYIKDFKIPTVVNTVTKVEGPKRQVFVGGMVISNTENGLNVNPGIIFKNKKDQLYKVTIGVGTNGGLSYGFGTYWKVKLN